MNPEMPYNPLDKHNLGKSVADALLARQNTALGEIEAFSGAGIYAIYYSGKFRPYAAISSRSDVLQREIPIYVGKAVPPGARKGNFGLNSDPGQALFRRLKEHAESIRLATNLEVVTSIVDILLSMIFGYPLAKLFSSRNSHHFGTRSLTGLATMTPEAVGITSCAPDGIPCIQVDRGHSNARNVLKRKYK